LGTPATLTCSFAQPSPFRSASSAPFCDLCPVTVPTGPFHIIDVSVSVDFPVELTLPVTVLAPPDHMFA